MRSDPKTPRSRRTLPLPSVVGDALAAHMAAFPPGADGSLFTNGAGRAYRTTTTGRASSRRPSAGPASRATTHDLRHHYASVLLAAGESVVAVAERLGHENANLVLSTCGHLVPGFGGPNPLGGRRRVGGRRCAPGVPPGHHRSPLTSGTRPNQE